jgi:hypothetical protein
MSSLLAPPAGWTECEPHVGEPIASTNLFQLKAPLSEARYRVPDGDLTPPRLVSEQRALGRAVRFIVEVSVRDASLTASAYDPDGASRSSSVVGSAYYDVDTELAASTPCRHVHLQVHLRKCTPVELAIAGDDPTRQPCPIDDESIRAFVTLIRGLVATTQRESDAEARLAAARAADPPAAAAGSPAPALPPFIAVHDLYGFNLSGFLLCCYLVEECGFEVMTAVNDLADARPPANTC